MLETAVYAALVANATVNRKCNTRIYPIVMPQGVKFPAITYQRISGGKVNTLDGYSGLANPHMVINSWATNYDTAKELSKDIHVTMNAATFKTILATELDAYDSDLGLFAVSQDFSVWGEE